MPKTLYGIEGIWNRKATEEISAIFVYPISSISLLAKYAIDEVWAANFRISQAGLYDDGGVRRLSADISEVFDAKLEDSIIGLVQGGSGDFVIPGHEPCWHFLLQHDSTR